MQDLSSEDIHKIENIANLAVNIDSNLEYDKCFTITALYFSRQFYNLPENEVPIEYFYPVKLLYKNPNSSYVHYRMDILYGNDKYATAIKDAEIELNGGDDPRCPW